MISPPVISVPTKPLSSSNLYLTPYFVTPSMELSFITNISNGGLCITLVFVSSSCQIYKYATPYNEVNLDNSAKTSPKSFLFQKSFIASLTTSSSCFILGDIPAKYPLNVSTNFLPWLTTNRLSGLNSSFCFSSNIGGLLVYCAHNSLNRGICA